METSWGTPCTFFPEQKISLIRHATRWNVDSSKLGEPSTFLLYTTNFIITYTHIIWNYIRKHFFLYPHYRPWRPTGDVDARVLIFTATALGWGRMASPTLGRLYPRGNSPVLILQEVEWTPGPVWTRRCEEKFPPLRHPELNPGRPARSQAPCRLSHLAHENIFTIINNIISANKVKVLKK